MTTNNEMNPFLLEVLATPGGQNVLQCYQCGTCAGSCPVLEEMEYGPRRIMYMIQAGMEREVLSSPDMWRCVSCYSCAHRCPRGIEITDLMADLRRLGIQKGYTEDKEAQFGQAFAETVENHGRMFEPELLGRYYLRVLDIVSLLGMVPLGLQMLVKGKLPFWPERIKNPEEMRKIGLVTSATRNDPQRLRTAWILSLIGTMMTLVSGVVAAAALGAKVSNGFLSGWFDASPSHSAGKEESA